MLMVIERYAEARSVEELFPFAYASGGSPRSRGNRVRASGREDTTCLTATRSVGKARRREAPQTTRGAVVMTPNNGQRPDGQTRLVPRRDVGTTHNFWQSVESILLSWILRLTMTMKQNNDIQDMPPTASKIPTSKMVALDQAYFVQYIHVTQSVST